MNNPAPEYFIRTTLERKIDKIRADFVLRLSENFIQFENLAECFEKNRDGRAALEQLSVEIHRVAGIAGSLGFFKLGKSAQACDAAICDYLARGVSLEGRESVLEKIDLSLAEIEAIISRQVHRA